MIDLTGPHEEAGVVAAERESAASAGRAGKLDLGPRPALTIVLAVFSLAFAAALLGLAFRSGGIAIVWPAAGIVTGLWLITPTDRRGAVLTGLVLGLFAGNLAAGRALLVNLMFVAANLAEAWLIGRLLARWIGKPVRLMTLPQVGWFILAVALTVTVGGAVGAAALVALPDGGLDYMQNWTMWVRSRGVGLLTVVPAVVALGSMTPQLLARQWREARGALLALVALLGVTLVIVSSGTGGNGVLGLLLLLALVYALVLVIAARSEPVWSYVALLGVTVIVVWRLGRGGGVFGHSVVAAQAFLFLSSLWVLTLGVVMQQQRQARERVQQSERSMRQALASGRGFTFEYDPHEDHIVREDPDRILAAFVTETGTSFFERVVPEDRVRLRQLVASLRPDRPMYETTYGSRRPDGRVIWLQERGVGEFDARGALVRLQGLTMDVTARREAEEALRQSARMKDRFIATLAHELRNPLAPIRTAAELLGSTRAGPSDLEWARRVIQRQVGHMGSLLDDLLDVARITRGKLDLRRQRVQLKSVIDTAVEVARPMIDSRSQQLTLDVPNPTTMLDADPLRLAQVISNLLTNAAKYSDDRGRIALGAKVDGPRLVVTVSDDGIGIPAEALPTLFEMFAQVEGTAERSAGGLGIGLSLVKGLVELHGGTVTAQSSGHGLGSVFTVTLPCVCAPAADPESPGASGSIPPSPARRLLIVDDNRDAADSLAMLLEFEGHDVRTAYTGQQAIETAQSFKPEIVVLDLGLPDLSGYEVAQHMRSDPGLGQVRLIALTGWGQDEHRRRALEAGFDHHLTKPVDPDQLQALLRGTVGS